MAYFVNCLFPIFHVIGKIGSRLGSLPRILVSIGGNSVWASGAVYLFGVTYPKERGRNEILLIRLLSTRQAVSRKS